ncbi:MAG: serine protease [Candidatus Nealsonbacteria bacterium]|nr:serine protease [Candidatus Nealsonbacteria bacterium]
MKNVFKILAIFILGAGGGIFAGQILRIYFPVEQKAVYVTERREIVIQENTALENAVEKTEKAVIGIRTKLESGEFLEGSGLAVTSDGLIVTLANLVPQGAIFSFYINGSSTSYQILRRDLKENLALIKLGRTDLHTLSFADLDKIKLGERVFLVGTGAVNEGIIRSFDENLITTNIFEESSLAGSPLFNIKGEALGINIINSEGKVMTIPISKIKEFIGM